MAKKKNWMMITTMVKGLNNMGQTCDPQDANGCLTLAQELMPNAEWDHMETTGSVPIFSCVLEKLPPAFIRGVYGRGV
jgi:hypothetical protein